MNVLERKKAKFAELRFVRQNFFVSLEELTFLIN